MKTRHTEDYIKNWELAISLYLTCFKWSLVADAMNLDVATIYLWLKEPLFKEMLDEAKDIVIKENQDKLRSDCHKVYDEMMWTILQRDDLTNKIKAIQEFNKMFLELDNEKKVSKSLALMEEIKNNVKNPNSSQEESFYSSKIS